MQVLTKTHSPFSNSFVNAWDCHSHCCFTSFCLWSVGLWILEFWVWRQAFLYRPLCSSNYATYIDFLPLRKRKRLSMCSAFLIKCVGSVYQFECCVKELTLAFQQLSNDHSFIKPQRTPFFRMNSISFQILPAALCKGHSSCSWHVEFPEGYFASDPAAVWWKLNRTVLLFIMRKYRHFPLDVIKGRYKQLTEITLLPGRSAQPLFLLCEQHIAANNMLVLLIHFRGLSKIIRSYMITCDTQLQRLISVIIY